MRNKEQKKKCKENKHIKRIKSRIDIRAMPTKEETNNTHKPMLAPRMSDRNICHTSPNNVLADVKIKRDVM